ncbi:MAG: hypothetical protein QN193_01790 [Armatimonadota bacterium]|nr:hypothetical protein [Armatimonadota bacterium]MDR7443481.1 hypothetical protein [Armatimonadota bacterium]MDR7569320.1 hypothetical protein [Armatimonadota bacterium]MDR7614980.1 hypothetical protein [Armatimonadota bacterium]
MSARRWQGRDTGLRRRFLAWHRRALPPWALAADVDLVEFRRVEPEPGLVLYEPVALVEVLPYGAPLPGPRGPQLEVLWRLSQAPGAEAVVVELGADLKRVRIRRLPGFEVVAEGGLEAYGDWLAKQHDRR